MTEMNFNNRTALVVDDSEVHRQIILNMLKAMDFKEVHVAGDGDEGIQMTKDSKPDVVICDLRMEPTNGFEYLRILRKSDDPELRQTRVIVASGLNSSGAVMKSVALESSAFIAKPFRRKTLEETLDRVFQ